jgi:hypothetical protein
MTSHPAFMNNRINKSIDQRSAAQRSQNMANIEFISGSRLEIPYGRNHSSSIANMCGHTEPPLVTGPGQY